MNLTDIGTYIDRKQPSEFLNVYLTCLAQGYSLSCPLKNNLEQLTKEWAKVLSKYRRDFSDEFCSGVATIWLELLSKCDPSSKDLELQLISAAGINIEAIENSVIQMPKKKTTTADIPLNDDNIQDPLTTPQISASYRERQLAEEVSLPELERLNNVYQKSFKTKDPDQFLISHLTFSKYGKEKKVPKSTVPQHIREGWESIIANEFNTIASDQFLVQLTNEWFYLVNQKGIPLKSQDQEEILMTFLAKKKRPQKKVEKKEPSLLKKLFGK